MKLYVPVSARNLNHPVFSARMLIDDPVSTDITDQLSYFTVIFFLRPGS